MNMFSDIQVSKASRRIKPTLVSSSTLNEEKCSAFNSVPIVPAPANAMPRSVWAKPHTMQHGYIPPYFALLILEMFQNCFTNIFGYKKQMLVI